MLTLNLAPKWVLPVGRRRLTAGFFDSNYNVAPPRQHLGCDFSVPSGQPVNSPIDAIVVTNKTDHPDVVQAYLVLKSLDGSEHVLGHINSSLAVGSRVKAGAKVGSNRAWPGNSLLHWGVNNLGIHQAMTGDWGWGRAPAAAQINEAPARGWVKIT